MKNHHIGFLVGLCLIASGIVAGAQDKVISATSQVTGQWVNISDPVAALAGKVERPGVTLVAVDPGNGDVYLGYGKAGLWKSVDQARSWALADGGKYNAMGVSTYSADFDPAGGRMAFWGMYGNNTMTLDGGKTWTIIGGHRDWGIVDWSDPRAQTLWANPHGGGAIFSFDGGQTWKKQPEDRITALGVFDAKTFAGLLVDAIFVSDEAGDNFVKKTRKLAPVSETCMRVYKGVGYWISPLGLIVSKDKGASWQVQGKPLKDPVAGPFFGDNENHIVVVTTENFMETLDGGQTWNAVVPTLADAHWDDDKGETRNCRFYAWDARQDIFYGGKLFQTAMKYVRPPAPDRPSAIAPSPAPVILETKVIWDGEKVFPKSFGHFDVRDGNSFNPQTDDVHHGKVALEMTVDNAPVENGQSVNRGGWNWRGWWPPDSGDDLTPFTHVVFWMKVEQGKTLARVDAGLESSQPRTRSAMVDVTRYCPTALDGQWHEIAIPASDLVVPDSKFNAKLVWELRIASRCEATQVPYSLFFDDLSFQRRAPATQPAGR